jgi:hypothetical protein
MIFSIDKSPLTFQIAPQMVELRKSGYQENRMQDTRKSEYQGDSFRLPIRYSGNLHPDTLISR